ncbi:MAG: hypothetical protein NT039_00150 [Candidatus Berkelbacteria bacterium]|nr:hypothetical protein [Candidatus Berkelbacteria bacterium]
MKKVIIALIVIVLVLGIGTGGVLFWGRTNAKADTAYAEKAKTLVNDYDKKYTDKYFEKQLDEQLTDDTKINKVKETLEDAKKF